MDLPQSTKAGSYRNTKAWKELRLKVLEDYPTCVWCKRRPSTEADHVIPVDAGIDPMDRSNLVGSCRPCNGRRGAQHGNKKAQKGIQGPIRPRRAREPQTVFGSPSEAPPAPLAPLIPENGTTGTDLGGIEDDSAVSGRIEPRLVTSGLGGESYGPLVAAWAESHMNVILMPWQIIALNGQLEHDDQGDLIRRESLVSVARQNGKTVALAALAGWWLTDFANRRGQPQTVFLTAHKLDRAQAIFYELEPVLERLGGKATRSYGRSSMAMPDGSQLLVRAATPTNAHGGTNDLIIVDELWSVQPTVVFDALRPSQIARRSPLLSMWSTAGDESSIAMLQLREQAINAIDAGRFARIYFAEWSPPPGVSLSDRRWWKWANPAMGTTITETALDAASDTPDQSAFYRAHLNCWVAAASAWLPLGVWDRCTTSTIPPGGIIAVDSSLDDSRYCGVRAVANDGVIHVEVSFVVDTARTMWDTLAALSADRSVQFALTPGLHAVAPPELARRSTIVGMAEQYTYTPIVRALILEDRLVHADQQNLAEHVGRAVLARAQNSIALSSQKSPGPIELARCMVWAAGMAAKPAAQIRKPMLGTSRTQTA